MAYLTAAQVRSKASRVMDLPSTQYTDADLDDLVAEFEEIAEEYLGVAYVVRTHTVVITVLRPTSWVRLTWPKVASVTSVTVNGAVVPAAQYDVNKEVGTITWDSSFIPADPATIVYTHGFATVPKTIQRACWRYVVSVLQSDDSGVGRDVLSQAFDGATTRYSTPDAAAGRPTGWLEVDRLLNSVPSYKGPMVA